MSSDKQGQQIKKFKGNEYAIPIYTPRTTYNFIRQNDELLLNDLTLNFDPFTISILKNEFKDRPKKAMEKTDFIMIIKDHQIHWQLDIPNREKKQIRCQSLLFNDIDLDGSNKVDWGEFTNYIIEKAAVLNTMRSKNDEIKSYQQVDVRMQKKFNQPVVKCIYISILDKIAWFEELSDEFYMANPETGAQFKSPTKVMVNEELKKGDDKNPPVINANKAMLMDMIFIDDPKYNLQVTSSNDGVIRMFRYSTTGFVIAEDSSQRDHEIVYENAQIVLVWDYVNEILYSGQRDGVINIWDQKSEPQFKQLGGKTAKNRRNDMLDYDTKAKTKKKAKTETDKDKDSKDAMSQESHTREITAMLPLPKLQFQASASFDKKIILWDTIEDKKKREYAGYHTRGIVALDFNEQSIQLISGGYDHQIFIWNPYIDGPVYKQTGHAAPIVSLKFIKNPLHIVSIDTDSTIKVWDVKKFKCLDSFSIENTDEKHTFNPQEICVWPKPLKLIIPGKNIVIYEYDRNNNFSSADENVSICTRFVSSSLSLQTPVGSKVKLWNLLTGEVKKIFSNLTNSDISVLILDAISKRFQVGDTDGNVGVFNVNNGALLKTLSKHKTEIISIIHAKRRIDNTQEKEKEKDKDFIITCSIDNVIKISEDSQLNESELIRTIEVQDMNITAIIYEPMQMHLITGSSNGVISLWEVSTGKAKGAFKDENCEEIAGITYLHGHSSLIYGTSVGKMNLLALPKLVVKQQKILTWKNKDMDKDLESDAPMCINSIYYCEVNRKLFIADEKFYIKCFDISEVIDIIASCMPSKEKSTSRKEPKLFEENIKLLWYVRAHDDIIRSMEYVEKENLIFTTCVDKRVKIFSSIDGEYVESLKQQKETNKIKPIAYKKVESDEIYTPRMEHRIDSGYMELFRKKEAQEVEIKNLQKLGILVDKTFDEKLVTQEHKKSENKSRLEAFQEYEQQEFNPYYYFDNKLDKEKIEGKKSNEWKLMLDYHKYYIDFMNETEEVHKGVIEQERVLKDAPQKKKLDQSESVIKAEPIENASQLKEKIKMKADKQDGYNMTTSEQQDEYFQKNIVREEEKKTFNVPKKKNISSNAQNKKLIKGKAVKEENKVKLSQSESDVARRLAMALESYDPGDPRNEKFLNYPSRKEAEQKNGKYNNQEVNFSKFNSHLSKDSLHGNNSNKAK